MSRMRSTAFALAKTSISSIAFASCFLISIAGPKLISDLWSRNTCTDFASDAVFSDFFECFALKKCEHSSSTYPDAP